MWLQVPVGEVQHLFVVELHLETNSLMFDMLLPMAAFQLSISQGSAATHGTWIFNAYVKATRVQLTPVPHVLWSLIPLK